MADTDSVIMYMIVLVFVTLGFIMPFINSSFGVSEANINTEGLVLEAGDETGGAEVSALKVVLSIFTMFFWSFGTLPAIVDTVIFVPLRILLAILIYRNIRGV